MNNLDKQNIYVPDDIYEILERDPMEFGILKKNGRINMNRFLSMLIIGYTDTYAAEYAGNKTKVEAVLNDTGNLSTEDRDSATRAIMQEVLYPGTVRQKGKKSKSVSLKPTKETEGVILFAETHGDNGGLSRYFCGMFSSYVKRNQAERERIVFSNTVKFLEKAIENGYFVNFSLKDKPDERISILPYRIAPQRENLHNYLIGEEKKDGRISAVSFRIDRIIRYSLMSRRKSLLDPTTKERLDRMLLYGPEFRINDDEVTEVKLSARGVRNFERIYIGRPVPYEKENLSDGNVIYRFHCSEDQLYLYFRRFDNAEILRPEKLIKRLRSFHKKALNSLRGTEDEPDI